MGRRFNAAGSPVGGDFQVNSVTDGYQRYPAVATTPDGGSVISWTTGSDIAAQRYDAAGSPLGGEFQVNIYSNSNQGYSAVAVDHTGEYMVTWASWAADTVHAGYSIQAQMYGAGGSANGPQYQLNSYTADWQEFPTVAALPNQEFAVAWQSNGSDGTDSDGRCVRWRRFISWPRYEAYDNDLMTDPAIAARQNMSDHVVADDFVLTLDREVYAAEVDWITWWWSNPPAGIEWYVFADAGGQPGSVVAQGVAVPESMTTTDLGEDPSDTYSYRTFFLFDQAVELEGGTTYWFGFHWGAPGDWTNTPRYAVESQSQSGATARESFEGTFDNWTSSQAVDRAFRLYATAVFADGFESGDISGW
jgi:hypothetical protein